MICFCGRSVVVEVRARNVVSGEERVFGLCVQHAGLGGLAGRIGQERAVREGAKVGAELVAALGAVYPEGAG